MAAIEALLVSQRASNPYLLEPIMSVEVFVPEEYMGDIIGNLSSRRGKVEGTETKGNTVIVKAKVPLGEMFGYVTYLRGMTKGRGVFNMEPSHYEQVPSNIALQIAEGKKS